MSQVGSQPANVGQAADSTLSAPARADEGSRLASSSTSHAQEEAAARQTTATTAQPSVLYGSANEKLGRSTKRSLTNLRRRDRSSASKRSAQQQNEMNEKDSKLASSGRTEDNGQVRPKKRSGFMAILCCSSQDDGGQDDNAQPAKAPTWPPPDRVSQPTQMRQQQPNAAVFDPSADESKEVVINEKAGQPPYSGVAVAQPGLPTHDAGMAPKNDATLDKPVPSLPADASPAQKNPEIRPLQDDRQQLIPEQPMSGQSHENTAAVRTEETALNEDFQGSFIAAAPVPTQAEDEMILDRTPEQAARDHDIEMSDAGPSLPLTGQDAAVVVEEEKLAHEKRESMALNQGDLPPPPPLQDRSDQATHDGTAPSTEASIVSTPEPPQKWLLPPVKPELRGKKCLVLDLDETLVHSSFKILHQADFTIPVEIEGQYHNVYVIKRPGVDAFMKRVGELYEIVVFTASVSKYGDPVLDNLDIHHVVHHRLFRESCYNHQGNYVKDLSQIGRDLRETIIIDNSPTSYIFHPQHAVPVSSWFSDAHDNELLDLIPVLEDLASSQVTDVSLVLDVAL